MNSITKLLLVAAGSLAAYKLIKRKTTPDLITYYRGKVAIVTGGASGIGEAIVEKLYALGANILVVDRNELALMALADRLPGIATLAIDLVEADAPTKVIELVHQQFGRLDLLFNNAGILFAGHFWDMTAAQIESLIQVNFLMQIRLTHAILPHFLARGTGVIAYTGSLSAHVHAPVHSVYTGTKGGLHNFVAALRREIPLDSQVQLTIVQPNITRTNLADPRHFDEVEKLVAVETAAEVALALLKGIARGQKEVFVRPVDEVYKWVERLAPAYGDYAFRKIDLTPKPSGQLALAPESEEPIS